MSEIPYFYKPIYFDEDLKPLAGLIIAISIYASDERLYLVQLAEILGAEVQETYIRVNKPLLICPEPKSPKYEAAIRWSELENEFNQRDWIHFVFSFFNYFRLIGRESRLANRLP